MLSSKRYKCDAKGISQTVNVMLTRIYKNISLKLLQCRVNTEVEQATYISPSNSDKLSQLITTHYFQEEARDSCKLLRKDLSSFSNDAAIFVPSVFDDDDTDNNKRVR